MTTQVKVEMTQKHLPVRITRNAKPMPITHEKLERLLAGFLQQLAADMSNAGCNDWDFPEDWTERERKDFAAVVNYHNRGSQGYDTSTPGDWEVVSFLANYFTQPAFAGGRVTLNEQGASMTEYVHSTSRLTIEELPE